MKTCSECDYYVILPQELTKGMCTVEPPQVIPMIMPQGIQIQFWDRQVPGDRNCCRHFQLKPPAPSGAKKPLHVI